MTLRREWRRQTFLLAGGFGAATAWAARRWTLENPVWLGFGSQFVMWGLEVRGEGGTSSEGPRVFRRSRKRRTSCDWGIYGSEPMYQAQDGDQNIYPRPQRGEELDGLVKPSGALVRLAFKSQQCANLSHISNLDILEKR